jgi:hypothetical protein
VKRTLSFLLLLATLACGGPQMVATGGGQTGGPDPRAALDGFLAGVRAQDLQVMSNYWGTADGPARNRLDRAELEKRELTMACYLAHDRAPRVIDDEPRTGNRRLFNVELSFGTTSRTTEIITVRGPSERWYVENADIRLTQALCEAYRTRRTGG